MDPKLLAQVEALVRRYMERLGGDAIDGRALMRMAMAGFLAGSGVPTDEAVNRAEQMAAPSAMGPVPQNPMYHGVPWLVPGPASGAPYYG